MWPFLRIGACLMVAPGFATAAVPRRYRLVLAAICAFLVAPSVSIPAELSLLSATGTVVALQQLVIGLVLGLCLQLAFDALSLGGQVIANSMGLSFAFNVDPLRGASTPAIGQLYLLIATLTFLALDGHLAIVQLFSQSFVVRPIGAEGSIADGAWNYATLGGLLFESAAAVALPAVTALLVVNISFGVISRAAPALNLFAVGFPAALLFGLLLLLWTLPGVQQVFVRQFAELVQIALQIISGVS